MRSIIAMIMNVLNRTARFSAFLLVLSALLAKPVNKREGTDNFSEFVGGRVARYVSYNDTVGSLESRKVKGKGSCEFSPPGSAMDIVGRNLPRA